MNQTIENINTRLLEITKLDYNWDYYKAPPVAIDSIKNAVLVLNSISIGLLNNTDYDDIYASTYGTVIIEWNHEEDYVCLDIGTSLVSYFYKIRGEKEGNDFVSIDDSFFKKLNLLLNRLYKGNN